MIVLILASIKGDACNVTVDTNWMKISTVWKVKKNYLMLSVINLKMEFVLDVLSDTTLTFKKNVFRLQINVKPMILPNNSVKNVILAIY